MPAAAIPGWRSMIDTQRCGLRTHRKSLGWRSISALSPCSADWKSTGGGGRRAEYEFHGSLDGKTWERLCGTRHGEGGQEVFGFPPTQARFVRLSAENPERNPGPDIVQINLYAPDDAVRVLEAGRIAALGHGPIRLPVGESITADFGYVRSPSGLQSGLGRSLRHRFLGLGLRRRQRLPPNGPHRKRTRALRQLLLAEHSRALRPAHSACGKLARRRYRQADQTPGPQQGPHAYRAVGAGGPRRARRTLSSIAARPAGVLDRAGRSGRAGRSALRRIWQSRTPTGGRPDHPLASRGGEPARRAWNARRSAAPSSAVRCRCQPSPGPLKAWKSRREGLLMPARL